MLSLYLRLASVFFLTVPLASLHAALPASAETQAHELTTIYSTTPAQPRLTQTSKLAGRIEPLLLQQAAYLLKTLRPWGSRIVGAQLLTDGSSEEHGIRPNAHAAYGFAILATCVEAASTSSLAAKSHAAALGLLRFLVSTHGAGGVACADGKFWNNQWQSALWTHEAGKAAWLLWDDLTPREQWLTARMVCDEAERFVDATPPVQVIGDTKSEENAWNSGVLSLAANMFPQHPQAGRWRTAAIRWIMNSYGRTKDLDSTIVVDGRTVGDWLEGAVLYDDYTLENHNRIHPDYMWVTRATMMQRMMYDWGQTTAPQALAFNVQQVHRVLKELAWPDGGVVYPNGQDWQIHRSPFYLPVHALHAIFFNDDRSAALMRMSLETAEAMAARESGNGVFLPEEFSFPSTRQYVLQILGETWLALRQYGDGPAPPDPAELFTSLGGLYVYPSGSFAVFRSPHSVATFSWGQKVMGMVLPLGKDLLITPNEQSLIGIVREAGKLEVPPRVVQSELMPTTDSLQLAGILERAGGKVEQRFAFVVLADGVTVYAEELISKADIPMELELGTLGVLNEPQWVYHNGTRTIYAEGQEQVFRADAPDTTSTVLFQSPWINVDDRLGVVCLEAGSHQAYIPRTAWRGERVEQILHLNHLPKVQGTAGTVLARTVLVLYPGQSAEQTRKVAPQCRFDFSTSGALQVRLEDKRVVSCDLQQLQVKVIPPN